MRIPKPFVKLPLIFDHARLAEEIGQFAEEDWRVHPERYAGNSSLILVSTNGEENDTFSTPMKPSRHLANTPYLKQVMASFDTVIGRSRLMRLSPGASVVEHTDSHYFWRNHLRLHVPIVTDPRVAFHCNGKMVHMAAGESWTFNNWLPHSVDNHSDASRIHLVIDTVGSASLWRMINGLDSTPRTVEFTPQAPVRMKFESYPGLPVLPTTELRADLDTLISDIADSDSSESRHKEQLGQFTEDFLHDWDSQWVGEGPTIEGFIGFKNVLARYRQVIDQVSDQLVLSSNGESFKEAIRYTLDAALVPGNLAAEKVSAAPNTPKRVQRPRFDRPIFIVAAPRSGSTLLFETLAFNRELWSLGDESHKQFESIAALRPSAENPSNRLTAEMATEDVTETLLDSFVAGLRSSDGRLFARYPEVSRPTEIRFLEKTPKNSLRIPFINNIFPDARFIFLFRDARQNISSLLDSWRSGRYVTYPQLTGWPPEFPWSHLLIPGWEKLVSSSLAEVVAQQWLVTNQIILDDLHKLKRDRWCAIEYDELIANTPDELQRLCSFSQIIFGPRMKEIAVQPLKPSKYTLTPPRPDKWLKNATEIEPVIPLTEQMMTRLRELL
jgi:hypothetical protein